MVPVLERALDCLCADPVRLGDIVFDASQLLQVEMRQSKTARLVSPATLLRQEVTRLAETCHVPQEDIVLPSKWQCHGDLAVLPPGAFTESCWHGHTNALWHAVAKALKVNRLVRQGRISDTGKRLPQVDVLLGDGTWVQHTDNGVVYSFDVQHCMFSQGNITEKIRMSKLSCVGETVVDMFAGIGYFTLPLLKHAKASQVHTCDWNQHAVDALKAGAKFNNVEDRCRVHFGDNREVCPAGIGDRVLLGLIPCSGQAWRTACQALKPTAGGWLHVHGNVSSSVTGHRVTSTPTSDGATGDGGAEPASCCALSHNECASSLPAHCSGASSDMPCTSTSSGPAPCGNARIDVVDDDVASSHTDSCVPCDFCLTDHCQYARHASVSTSNKCNLCSLVHDKADPPRVWQLWADQVIRCMLEHFKTLYAQQWCVQCHHIEHVKSYAPHIDHIVLDIQCLPPS